MVRSELLSAKSERILVRHRMREENPLLVNAMLPDGVRRSKVNGANLAICWRMAPEADFSLRTISRRPRSSISE
jgi:hypothetical protein